MAGISDDHLSLGEMASKIRQETPLSVAMPDHHDIVLPNLAGKVDIEKGHSTSDASDYGGSHWTR